MLALRPTCFTSFERSPVTHLTSDRVVQERGMNAVEKRKLSPFRASNPDSPYVQTVDYSKYPPPPWRNNPSGPGTPRYRCFTITLGHNTLGRTSLDVLSFQRNDVYLTTHNTHKRQTSMPPEGFETAIPASERPQTHALDRAATGIGSPNIRVLNILDRIDNAIDNFRVFFNYICVR